MLRGSLPLRRLCEPSAIAAMALGCSSPTPAAPRFVLTSGHEPDPWHQAPEPKTVVVTRVAEDGTRSAFLSANAPLSDFSIQSSTVARYELSAKDASNNPVASAKSLLLDQATFVGLELPLFFARSGTLARPPGDLDAPGDAPALTLVAGRSILIAARATSTGVVSTERYDFGAWAPVPRRVGVSCGSASCRFDTLASAGSSMVLAVGPSAAMWLDLANGSSGTAPLPAGLDSYAEIAGGRSITGPDGTAYVVGATRASGETSAVLTIAPDGTLGVMRLTAPRAGAAVTWLDGLVVVGGNARAAGAERWVVNTTGFTALDYPPDTTTGAALAPFDAHSVVRLGGNAPDGTAAPGVLLAVDCQSACSATAHSAALGLASATVSRVADGSFVVAGTDPQGQTAVTAVVDGATSPVPLREPRAGATAIDVYSLGELALIGGHHSDGSAALSVELFVQ